jgi:hypothetical protein
MRELIIFASIFIIVCMLTYSCVPKEQIEREYNNLVKEETGR